MDLMISFRGTGWQFGDGAQRKDYDKFAEPLHSAGVDITVVLKAWTKPLRDVLVFRIVLWGSSRLETHAVKSQWQLQAIHTVTWIATSVPFINACQSTWNIIGTTIEWVGASELCQIERYNPSPWGPIGAVIEYGLAEHWGVTWHSYFKLGFQSAADMIIPRTTNPKLKQLTRLARMFLFFLLSGTIHACGSHMLSGPSQPSKEFLFFALQWIAVIAQIMIWEPFVDRRLRRVLNPVGIVAWLYWTEPLIFGDQRDGGMWRIS